MPKEKVEGLGIQSPTRRAGQPRQVAPSFLFLACEDSSYMSGQTLRTRTGGRGRRVSPSERRPA